MHSRYQQTTLQDTELLIIDICSVIIAICSITHSTFFLFNVNCVKLKISDLLLNQYQKFELSMCMSGRKDACFHGFSINNK